MTFIQQVSIIVPGDSRPLPVWNLNGVRWHDAPRPRRWHQCEVQTRAWLNFELIERCACGAMRHGGIQHRWINRNERRT